MYYKPNTYNDYASILNKCEKYEMKDIITDEIHYDFVDLCRRDEDKCGMGNLSLYKKTYL